MKLSKEHIAIQFGHLLDQDAFEDAKMLLTKDCLYEIHDRRIIGRDEIMNLYESNMKEGKEKFDELIWGKSRVEMLYGNIFEVYFSDFLRHKGISHNYQCKQRLEVTNSLLICHILHIELPGEREKLQAFYEQVGLNQKSG